MTSSRQMIGLGFVAVALILRIASEPTANLSYILIAAYAMFGRSQAIEALSLSWLFTMLSPGIAPEATAASVGRYAVMLGAVLSVLMRSRMLRRGMRVRPVVIVTLMLGGGFVVHSWIFSPLPDVSVLKAVSWTVAMSALVSAWAGLGADERERLAGMLFRGLVALMVLSLPLLALPQGYLVNGTGFQGVLNHPQAFGPTMALLGAWGASRMFSERQPPWSTVVLVGTCLAMVVLSEARTAGVAMVIGVGLAVLFAPTLSGRSLRVVLPGLRSTRIFVLAGLALVGLALAGAKLEGVVSHYISKSGRAEANTLGAAYEDSRGGKMDEMWANISEKPLQGIGFGIASDPAEMNIERDPVFGLPIGAAVEKGVLPLAVLEEVGLFGFIMVAAWMVILLRRGARGGMGPVTVGLTVLVLNMGESTLFSPGGFGMLSLVLIGWVFASGQNRGPAE